MEKPAPGAARNYIQLVLTDRSPLTEGRDFGVMSSRTWRLADLGAKHALLLEGIGWGNMPREMVQDRISTAAGWSNFVCPIIAAEFTGCPPCGGATCRPGPLPAGCSTGSWSGTRDRRGRRPRSSSVRLYRMICRIFNR